MKWSILFISIILSFNNLIQGQAIDNDSLLKVIIKAQEKIDSINISDKQIMFSIGGNLNFLANPKIEGLYYDVSSYFPSLDSTGRWAKIGFGARLAQGRFQAAKDSFILRNAKSLNSDSSQVIDQDYNYRTGETKSYLTLSMTPTIRIFGKKSPLHFAFYFEFLRNTRLLNIEQIVTRQDTFAHVFDPRIKYSSSPIRTENRTIDIVDYNILPAVGIKFFKKYKKIDLDITTLWGYGGKYPSRGGWDKDLFYLTHFEAHYKGTGSFKIGGAIRGYIDEAPFATVYLAKTFSFQTLASLFK